MVVKRILPKRILVVEDVPSLAMLYQASLAAEGHDVTIADTGAAVRAAIGAGARFDAVLLDLQLPDGDGLDLLRSLPALARDSAVVVITADGSIARAIAAMRHGARDFLVKPLSPERLRTTIAQAIASMPGEATAPEGRAAAKGRPAPRDAGARFHGFIGASRPMQIVYRVIENVADSKATVFVTGESGTGKEVTAEAIHAAGRRRDKPFVAINCGAIPENLLESELFGHVKGAFTGAIDHRTGAARAAHGGTLFLDEICEMETRLQVKLLRFLQTGMVQPVGAAQPVPVDVRVICATNRDPLAEVAAGRFREDLYYRLAVIPLDLPPLRERGEDVERIAQAFVDRFAREEGKTLAPLDAAARAALHTWSWPGNVRELQNHARRAVVLSEGPALSPTALLPAAAVAVRAPSPLPQPAAPPAGGAPLGLEDLSGLTLDEVERRVIDHAIARADGNLPAAARALGVSASTLYRKRERWNAKPAA